MLRRDGAGDLLRAGSEGILLRDARGRGHGTARRLPCIAALSALAMIGAQVTARPLARRTSGEREGAS